MEGINNAPIRVTWDFLNERELQLGFELIELIEFVNGKHNTISIIKCTNSRENLLLNPTDSLTSYLDVIENK